MFGLGALFGVMVAVASDVNLTLILALLFPGLPIGVMAGRQLGIPAGVFVAGLSNGAVYGLCMYGVIRAINSLVVQIPEWSWRVGVTFRHYNNRR